MFSRGNFAVVFHESAVLASLPGRFRVVLGSELARGCLGRRAGCCGNRRRRGGHTEPKVSFFNEANLQVQLSVPGARLRATGTSAPQTRFPAVALSRACGHGGRSNDVLWPQPGPVPVPSTPRW